LKHVEPLPGLKGENDPKWGGGEIIKRAWMMLVGKVVTFFPGAYEAWGKKNRYVTGMHLGRGNKVVCGVRPKKKGEGKTGELSMPLRSP